MAEPVTYSGYLRLDQLLSAQQPKSSEHDEMLFIVIHQIYELWFKQLLHEFGKVQAELEAGSTTHAMRTLRRTLAILKIVVAQLDVLETMTPTQFTRFRNWLGTSSGFESAQFRELEAVLGRRDRMMVAQYAQDSAERERITAAMSRPSLFDSFARYLAGQGYDVPGAEEGLRRRHRRVRGVRAPGRRGRGDAGVALSPRQDGGADDRRPARHRRLGRRHLPAEHARPADLPRPVGRQEHGLGRRVPIPTRWWRAACW